MVEQNLTEYAQELLDMMKKNKKIDYNRTVFGKRAVHIGHEVYNKFGADGLFDVMRLLSEHVLYSENLHQSEYFTDLRELECKWSGITHEFQC